MKQTQELSCTNYHITLLVYLRGAFASTELQALRHGTKMNADNKSAR